MFESLRGTLIEASPTKAVVEVYGIGYGVHIPLSAHAQLPPLGQEVFFHLCPQIREDAHKLYGFLSKPQRNLFETLNTISGIGPKTALALLGHLDAAELYAVVATGDVRTLARVPGVGKKTAERLIVEMRGKGPKQDLVIGSSGKRGIVADAVSALVNLGHNPLHAQRAVQKVLEEAGDAPPLPDLLRAALQLCR